MVYALAMPCPCCLGGLTRPPPFLHAREGDRYCPLCEWVFAVEILQGEDPLVDILTCPRHGPATRWVVKRRLGA